MTTQSLDRKLETIKDLEEQIKDLSELKEKLRSDILTTFKKEELGQYKNDFATISLVERKTIKYLVDKEELINTLSSKYIEVIPKHKEINTTQLQLDLQSGIEVDGVELDVKENLMIRLNK